MCVCVCAYVWICNLLTYLLTYFFTCLGEDSQDRPSYMNYIQMLPTDTNLSEMLNHITSLLSAMYDEEIRVKLGMDVYNAARKVLTKYICIYIYIYIYMH